MKESHSTEKLYVATENIQNSLNNEIIHYLSNNNIDYLSYHSAPNLKKGNLINGNYSIV